MPYKKTLTRTRFKSVIRVLGNQICAKFLTLPWEKQQHFFPNAADVARLKKFINFCDELLLKQLIHFNQIRWRIFVHLPSWWKLKNKLSCYLNMMRKLALRDRKNDLKGFIHFLNFISCWSFPESNQSFLGEEKMTGVMSDLGFGGRSAKFARNRWTCGQRCQPWSLWSEFESCLI